MTETTGERLKRARLAAGYQSAASAARVLGVNPQNVVDHEADRRNLLPDKAAGYARLYRVTPAHLLYGEDGAPVSDGPVGDDVRMVNIIGEVRAGAFAEIPDEPPTSWEAVPVRLPEYARASLYALTVVGRSMDRFYPDGSAVVVCPTAEAGVREGDHVVVRMWRGAMAETTLKEVVVADRGVELWPRSTDPAYQTPLKLHTIRDAYSGPEIIGVVVGSFASRAARSGPLINLDSEKTPTRATG